VIYRDLFWSSALILTLNLISDASEGIGILTILLQLIVGTAASALLLWCFGLNLDYNRLDGNSILTLLLLGQCIYFYSKLGTTPEFQGSLALQISIYFFVSLCLSSSMLYLLDWDQPWQIWPFPTQTALVLSLTGGGLFSLFIEEESLLS